jgi:arsenate reductase
MYKSQKQFDAVIAVCSQAASGKCPIFPGRVKRWNWPFNDPSQLTGDREQILARTREISDEIKGRILSFMREYDEKGVKLFIE